MRIGIFTDTYSPDVNGVARSAELLKTSFEELGHEVFVVCTHPGVTIKEEGNIIRVPGVEIKKFYGYAIAQPLHPLLLSKIKSLDLDIIHAETEFGVGIFANMVADSLKIPLVRTYHTDYVDYMNYFNITGSELIGKGLKGAVSKLSKLFGNNCLRLMTPSAKTASMLKECQITTKIDVIPNGIDLSSFKPKKDKTRVSSIKKELKNKDEKLLVYVGRCAKEKSLDMILESFIKIKKEKLKIKLVVVGLGPQLNEYKKYVKDNKLDSYITFVGKKPFEDVPYYYQAGDAFISASTSETQGLTYIEGLAAGLPIIVRKDDVLDDILIENVNGFSFNGKEDIYDVIYKFYKLDSKKLLKMKQDAIKSVKKYDSVEFAKNTLNIYEDVIEEFKKSFVIDKIKLKNDVVSLYLSNSLKQTEKLYISVDDFYDNGLRINNVINSELLQYLKQREEYAKAYKSCIKKLSLKDYTKHQIFKHLDTKFELTTESKEQILHKLESLNLLNDSEYTKNFIKRLNSKMFSFKAINRKLNEIGVTKDIIQDALNSVAIDDKVNCDKKAYKYFYAVKGKSSNLKKQTIISKLVNDGFSLDKAKDSVSKLDFSEDMINDNKLIKKEAMKAYNKYVNKYEGSELRNKIFQSLISKGFEYEYVYIAINELEGLK